MDGYDILLVGGGSHLFMTLAWGLRCKGYRVKSAADSEAALEALVKKNFDLLIARLSQDKDILGVLQQAKLLNPAVKIMAMGGRDPVFPRRAYEMDLDDYLMMPLTPAELYRRVGRCLKREDLRPPDAPASLASRINGQVLRRLRFIFGEIRDSMAATMGHLETFQQQEQGDADRKLAQQLWGAAARLAGIMDLSEELLTRIAAQASMKPAPEEKILDLVLTAGPSGGEAYAAGSASIRHPAKKGRDGEGAFLRARSGSRAAVGVPSSKVTEKIL